MIAGVADTDTALWYLLGNSKLSVTARNFIENTASAGHTIALSTISLAEIVYLVEKNRLPPSAYARLQDALTDPDYVIEEAPFNREVVESMRSVSRAEVPDMPDRIVAATALYLGVPVISRDGQIRSSAIETVW